MARLQKDFEAVFDQFGVQHFFPDGALEIYNGSAFSHPAWPILTSEEPCLFTRGIWGLVPPWVKDRDKAIELRRMTLNARSETIWEKPSFRSAASSGRRCLIPVDGFFEPFHHEKKSYPFYIHKRGALFSLGGIYDIWTGPESGEAYLGFSVLTIPSKGLVDKIHNRKHRMPLIIAPQERSRWLDKSLPEEQVRQVMASAEAPDFEAHPVSKELYRHTEGSHGAEIRTAVKYGIEAVDNLVHS
jgi:putative SOS response-associated peptidase YedK